MPCHEDVEVFSALDAKTILMCQHVFAWLLNGWLIFEFSIEILLFKEVLYMVTRLMILKEDEKTLCVQLILVSQESRLWSLADWCSKNTCLGQWYTFSSICKRILGHFLLPYHVFPNTLMVEYHPSSLLIQWLLAKYAPFCYICPKSPILGCSPQPKISEIWKVKH